MNYSAYSRLCNNFRVDNRLLKFTVKTFSADSFLKRKLFMLLLLRLILSFFSVGAGKEVISSAAAPDDDLLYFMCGGSLDVKGSNNG